MIKKRFFLIVIFVMITPLHSTEAQVMSDSTRTEPPEEKSPTGAMLRSALIPGWGQWYSDQKLKAVIVFGAQMALIGNAVYYHQKAIKSQTPDDRDFYLDYKSVGKILTGGDG